MKGFKAAGLRNPATVETYNINILRLKLYLVWAGVDNVLLIFAFIVGVLA